MEVFFPILNVLGHDQELEHKYVFYMVWQKQKFFKTRLVFYNKQIMLFQTCVLLL
jgi:hypothetical protein